MSARKVEGESEIADWQIVFEHVDGLYPIFAEHGYTRGECLNAWLLREIARSIPSNGHTWSVDTRYGKSVTRPQPTERKEA